MKITNKSEFNDFMGISWEFKYFCSCYNVEDNKNLSINHITS